jgi:hypothetical protein
MVLLWLIALPTDVIRESIEDAVARSGHSNMSLSVEGLRKGIFFALYADSLNLKVDNTPALKITDFKGNYSPRYLTDRQLGFSIKGKVGSGDVRGVLKVPLEGTIRIDRAELKSIPYLEQFGMNIKGSVTSDINIINDVVKVIFEVPDLNIDDSASVIPLLNTFRKLQGALSVKGNSISVDSISLEGDKGYARLKGDITNNVMNLALELMPAAGKLNTMESMLVGKYIVSPGYYVVPIKGPLP